MENIKKFWYFLLFSVVINISNCIYTPYNGLSRKPHLSPGIKTSNWKNPHAEQISMHHNYSHVNYQTPTSGNALTPAQIQDSTTRRLFPIYRPDIEKQPSTSREGEQYSPDTSQKVIIRVKKQLQAYNKCPSGAMGQFVYTLSCNQFLNCWKGRTFIQNCAPGTLFNPDTLTCDHPDKVRCITGPRQTMFEAPPSRTLHTLTTRQVQPNCPKDFSGTMPNYSNCSKFVVCVSGNAMNQVCPPGTLFDTNRNICDYPKLAKCFNGQNQNIKSENVDYFLVDGSNKLEEVQSLSQLSSNSHQRQYDYGSVNCGSGNQCPPSNSGPRCGTTYCNNSPTTPNRQNFNTPQNQGVGTNCGEPNRNCAHSGTNINIHRQPIPSSTQTDYQPAGSSNRRVYQRPDCFPPNCSPNINENQGFIPDNPNNNNCGPLDSNCNRQRPTNSYQNGNYGQDTNRNRPNSGAPQYNNCGVSNSNCNRHQGSIYQTNYGQSPDRLPDASNAQITRCNPRIQNCGSVSNYGQQPNYSGQTVIDLNRGCRGNNCDQRGTQNRGTLPANCVLQNGRCVPVDPNSWGYVNGYDQNQFPQSHENRPYTGYLSTTPRYTSGITENWEHVTGYNPPNGDRNQPYTGYLSTTPKYDLRYTGRPITPRPNRDTFTTPRYNFGQLQSATCPEGAVGVHPHPYDCSKFLNCANGQTFEQKCGPGTLFDAKMLTCDFDYKVNCNIRATTEIHDNSITTHRTNSWNYNPDDEEPDVTTSITYLTPNSYNRGHPNGHFVTRPPSSQNSHPSSDDEDLGANRPGFPTGKPIYPIQNIDQHLGNDQKHETAARGGPRDKTWPPPFPATDTNADYVYEYYDADVEANINAQNADHTLIPDCSKDGFVCSQNQKKCVLKNLVCDGKQDCPNGRDEQGCSSYLGKFEVKRDTRMAVIEKERWDNTTVSSCAYMCLESKKFNCRSFNYRKVDNCCLLSDVNEGITGRLMAYQPNDYYELRSAKIDCKDKFKCNNNKCIDKTKICDGQNDCVDREDEKNCKAEKIGFGIRLAGGNSSWEGRIEVSAFGRSGFVCDDKFDIRDADVVCKELGYKLGAAEIKGNSYFAKDVPLEKVFYMMDDVVCRGNETSIRNCDFNGWGSHDCTNEEVVGVVCKTEQEQCPESLWKCKTTNECIPLPFVCDGPEDCTDGSEEAEELCKAPVKVRIVNGTNKGEGRLEVRYHDIWGTVCDDDFNDDAAKVVCKTLGFKGTATVKKEAYFGQGTGPIWLDQVSCLGNETSLDQCSHWKWGEHNCDHSEDLGIICSNSDSSHIERHVKNPHGVKISQITTDPAYPIYPTKCGLRKNSLLTAPGDVHFRVVKGSKAKPGDYPWQAALRVKGKLRTAHWCGAVVISSKFVLTAAHCLVGYPKGAYVVVAGDYNIQEDEGTEQYSYIEDYYIHEHFRKGHQMNNDIALVKLKGQGFKLNQDVQAICLPDSDTDYNIDLNCTISGFGSIESGSSAFSNELRAGTVPLQQESVCKMPHVYGPNLTDGMFCAGALNGGIDACDGDSGGPLACLDEGFFTLYGITSWGQRCGYANKPGVYVKVAHYRKWIDDKIRKNL